MTATGRLIYSLNVSLDGFAATPDGGLERRLAHLRVVGGSVLSRP